MTLSQPNQKSCFLTDTARLTLHTIPEQKDNLLDKAYAEAQMDFPNEVKREMELVNEAMSAACFVNKVYFCVFEEIPDTGAGENLSK